MVQLRPDVPFPRQTPRYRSTFNADLENLLRNAVRVRDTYREMMEQRRLNTFWNQLSPTIQPKPAVVKADRTTANWTREGLNALADLEGNTLGATSQPLIKAINQLPIITPEKHLAYRQRLDEARFLSTLSPEEITEYTKITNAEAIRAERERTDKMEELRQVPKHLQHLIDTPEKRAQWEESIRHKEVMTGKHAIPGVIGYEGAREEAPLRQEDLHGRGGIASVFTGEAQSAAFERAHRYVMRPIGTLVGSAILEKPAQLIPKGLGFKGWDVGGRTVLARPGTTVKALREALEALMTDEGIDLDAATTAWHDQFNAVPGFWAAMEMLSPPFAIGPLGMVEAKIMGGTLLRGSSIPARTLLTPEGGVRHALKQQTREKGKSTFRGRQGILSEFREPVRGEDPSKLIEPKIMDVRALPEERLTAIDAQIAAKGVPEWAQWKGKAIAPYSGDWVRLWKRRPDLRDDMDAYLSKLEQGIPPSSTGVVKNSNLDLLTKSMKVPHSINKETFSAANINKKRKDFQRWLKENFVDRFAGFEDWQNEAEHWWRKTYKQELPDEYRGAYWASIVSGSPSQAAYRVSDTLYMAQNLLKTKSGSIHTDHLESYLIAKHQIDVVKMTNDERLILAGNKELVGTKGAESLLKDLQDLLGPEKYNHLELAGKVVTDHYANILKREVFSGRVSKTKANFLRSHFPNYNPIGYQGEVGSLNVILGGAERVGTKKFNDALKRLGTTGLVRPRQKPTSMLYAASIRSAAGIARNDAARAIIQNGKLVDKSITKLPRTYKPGDMVDEGMGALSYFENGELVSYQVPEWAAREASRLELSNYNVWSRVARTMQAPWKASYTQYNPVFMSVDAVFNLVTTATMRGVLPHRVATSFLANLKTLLGPKGWEDPTFRRMIDAGGDVAGWHGRDPSMMLKGDMNAGNIVVRNAADLAKFLNPLHLLRETGHALEMAPRRAVFKKSIERGSSDLVAAVNARRSVVDFARGGNVVLAANNLFLYLNPAVQGLMLPYRAMKSNPVQAGIGVSSLMSTSAGLYAWNRQFPEYHDIDQKDRYNGFIIMMPSTEVDQRGKTVAHFIKPVPILRELGMFHAPITYLLERLDGEDHAGFGEFIKHLVQDIMSPVESVATLSIPTQASTVFNEIRSNRDTFSGRPIIPPEMRDFPPEEQYNEYTSLSARRIGEQIGMSPMIIDHMLNQGALRDILLTVDGVIRSREGVDVEADGIMSYLQHLTEITPPNEIPLRRMTILNSLDPDLRKRVQEAERTPEPRLPVVGTIANRFNREDTGNLYRVGLKHAIETLGISKETYNEYLRVIAANHDEINSIQYDMEMNFEAAEVGDGETTMPYGGREYRNDLKRQSQLWNGIAYSMGLQIPKVKDFADDAVLRAEFFNEVYTLAGGAPDSRSRSALIYTAFRTLPIVDLPDGTQDWRKYNAALDEFKLGLSENDKYLLELEIQSRMTPFHRENFHIPMEQFKWYWHLEDDILKRIGPGAIEDYRHYKQQVKPQGAEYTEWWLRNFPELEWVTGVEDMVTSLRVRARQDKKVGFELESFLLKWDYIGVPMNEEVKERRFEIAPVLLKRMTLTPNETTIIEK
jgi:hypothetical protein